MNSLDGQDKRDLIFMLKADLDISLTEALVLRSDINRLEVRLSRASRYAIYTREQIKSLEDPDT